MQILALEVQRSERAAAAITKSRLTAHQTRLKALEWDHEVSARLLLQDHHILQHCPGLRQRLLCILNDESVQGLMIIHAVFCYNAPDMF